MAPEDDYYAVLGVESTASADEIKKAFRERVRACHPDRVANLDEDLRRLAEEKMVELNEAYAVLRNQARRAAYDARFNRADPATATMEREPVAPTPQPATQPPRDAAPPPPSGSPLADPAEARNRIGEQRFVARAASEEFQHTVKRSVSGQVQWAPLAFRGATEAMHGRQGRSNLYFVMLATPQLDDKQAQRFLKSIDRYGSKLKQRLFGQDRIYGFLGAVEFTDIERQRSLLERFNKRCAPKGAIRPATYIDLVNWHVVPGEIPLQERLEDLMRAS